VGLNSSSSESYSESHRFNLNRVTDIRLRFLTVFLNPFVKCKETILWFIVFCVLNFNLYSCRLKSKILHTNKNFAILAVVIKFEIFWDVTPCRLVNSFRRFERSFIFCVSQSNEGLDCLMINRETFCSSEISVNYLPVRIV
jgi:hypothetical protein